MTVGKIAQVDPTTLTIAVNVRTDTKVDKEFVASIKELGVLQPPMVTKNGNGYEVVLGQRRVLASVEAGLKTIPVYVVDKSEADAARVVDQLTENEQRQHLSPSEVVGGYKQLALFGLSPAQIAKKVSRPRKSIDTALAIADDEKATSALDEGLTLDQAAILVEFNDDKAAVKRLTESAPAGLFDHTVKYLRDKRDFTAEQDRLNAELATERVLTIPGLRQEWDRPTLDGHKLAPLNQYSKPGAPTEPLQPADVKKKNAVAGELVRKYVEIDGAHKSWPVKRYWLVDPDESGFVLLERETVASRDLTAEELAANEEREAKWAMERAVREAIDAAATVRGAWLREFLQRKSLPALTEILMFVAESATKVGVNTDDGIFDWLGAPLTDNQIDSVDEQDVEQLLMELAKRCGPQKYLVAAALSTCELAMRSSWSRDEAAQWYLPQLASWGYGLSDAEKDLIDDATTTERATK